MIDAPAPPLYPATVMWPEPIDASVLLPGLTAAHGVRIERVADGRAVFQVITALAPAPTEEVPNPAPTLHPAVLGCVAAGEEPEAVAAEIATYLATTPTPPVPKSVRNSRLRQALVAAGLYEQVQAAVAAAGDVPAIRWDYEDAALRADPLLNALATQLGLTSAQVDDIFRAAAQIP